MKFLTADQVVFWLWQQLQIAAWHLLIFY